MKKMIALLILLVAVNEIRGAEAMKKGGANVNGTSLYYEMTGKGFPLVFISGGGMLDRRGWDEQFESFAKDYRVIRYDIRGIGKSSRPREPFSHSRDLYEFLKFLKVKRTHLIGLSVGGAIAIDFTLDHPEMVDHLILAASGLSDDAKADANLQRLSTLSSLTKKVGIERVIQMTLDSPFVVSKENATAREKIRQIYVDNRDVFESEFPLYSLWEPSHLPAGERLSEIRARALIIRGDNDSPAYIAMTDKIGFGIKGSRKVVIPGGTHLLNLEKPREFNRAVLEFLSKTMKKMNGSSENIRAREAWDMNARFWDERMADGNDFFISLVWPSVEKLLRPRPGEKLLDVACGNGLTSRRLAHAGATVVAFDFSEEMIRVARTRPIDGQIDYRVVDATDADALRALGSRTFDGALCNMALMDMSDIRPLMNGVASLLRPGGRFVFSLLHPCFNNPSIVQMGELQDREGVFVTTYSVKVSRYLTPYTQVGLAMHGQPVPHPYFHRPLGLLLQDMFEAGFALDALEERCRILHKMSIL